MSRDQARIFSIACAAAAVVVFADQTTKAAALTRLSEEKRIPLLGDLLGLQLAFNPGALLSLGSGATWLLTLLGLAATVFLVGAATRARTGQGAVGIGLILGGALGNLIDRLFSPPGLARGHVTDFLAYGDLFIGNLADVALGAGMILVAATWWGRYRAGARSQAGSESGPSPNQTLVADP